MAYFWLYTNIPHQVLQIIMDDLDLLAFSRQLTGFLFLQDDTFLALTWSVYFTFCSVWLNISPESEQLLYLVTNGGFK